MLSRLAQFSAVSCLLLLLFVLQFASAQESVITNSDGSISFNIRDLDPELEPEPERTNSSDDNGDNGSGSVVPTTGTNTQVTSTATSKHGHTATTTDDTSPTSTQITSDGRIDNSTLVNATIPDGALPLAPEITPGWGVAGAVMLITGLAYTLIGIKNRWIHTFFSSAYLVSLGVAVLIVYVMKLPVNDAVQGGFVVAVVVSGCLLGAASVFFKELTEGLGCALGGFCLSMWLLCLVPGGLLHPVPSKAIFISVFTLVGFIFYFSRWTRDWALIVLISFAGATVTVLGIDCFSRAGLKEFWAYIWELNEDLFPLGADTYPVTKGIRVETAAIVIIFLFGIVSQVKLWRVVREQREKRAAERAKDRQNLDEEEANIGRQVEETNDRERRRWERAHGDGEMGSSTSDMGDLSSEKKLRNSHARSSMPQSTLEDIEMNDMSESDNTMHAPEQLMTEQGEEGKVTVRVAVDEMAEGGNIYSPADEQDTASRRQSRTSASRKRVSEPISVPEAPDVVPLPFAVPQEPHAESRSERSSIATFADEDQIEPSTQTQLQRRSFTQRLSRGSGKLLRSLSKRSLRTANATPSEDDESSDELVVPRAERHGDDASLVATIDNESLSDRHSIVPSESRKSIEITAELADRVAEQAPKEPSQCESPKQAHTAKSRHFSTATVSTGILNQPEPAKDAMSQNVEPEPPMSPSRSQVDAGDGSGPEPSEKPKSVVSAVSNPVSLTKEHLPRSLSRIALSYRTNEWAKHLSYADTPEPEEMVVHAAPKSTKKVKEAPVPVNVEELQQSLDNERQVPVVKPSESQTSLNPPRKVSRSTSKQGLTASSTSPTVGNVENDTGHAAAPSPGPNVVRSASSMGLRRASNSFEPIAEERDAPTISAAPIAEEIDEPSPLASGSPLNSTESLQRGPIPGVVSYDSPQTLLGQRDIFLRSRSQGNLLATIGDPGTASPRPPSEAGSMYNYPMYAAALASDPDDLPLSQRKQFMRQGSMMSLTGSQSGLHRMSSGADLAENSGFNSHQPQRGSGVPTAAAREAKLANFRNSVAQDLRAGTPVMMTSARDGPFASTSNLLSDREAEVQRGIEMQRSMLLGQKDAEAQRREMQRQEKAWVDRAFDERMRSGELLDAHREAMRRMQRNAKEQ